MVCTPLHALFLEGGTASVFHALLHTCTCTIYFDVLTTTFTSTLIAFVSYLLYFTCHNIWGTGLGLCGSELHSGYHPHCTLHCSGHTPVVQDLFSAGI